jgi:cytochrome oxidase Cu insertion factor (SCO1/SenC/PrrC family)
VIEVGAELRSHPPYKALAVVLAGAIVVGVGIGIALHFVLARSAPVTAGLQGQATWAVGARPAPPITTLRDQTGRLFSLSSLHGRTVAMTFFDSHCNQACPLEGRALAAAERALPAAQRPVLVVVTVNPRDTPASATAAARRWGIAQAGSWHWLWGRRAQLARVWRAYHIFVAPARGDIVHTEALYLIDRRGYERSAYLYPFDSRFVTRDLARLAAS